MIHIRRAGPLDAGPLSDLLNRIIRQGGTTAMSEPVSRQDLHAWMQIAPSRSAWHLAEDSTGTILGVQWIEPHPDLPPEACDIATFARIGHTGVGIGSRLFETTRAAARALGYSWINATIRADNPGGLAYYQSRGFEDYARHPGIRQADGTCVDKISKRHTI